MRSTAREYRCPRRVVSTTREGGSSSSVGGRRHRRRRLVAVDAGVLRPGALRSCLTRLSQEDHRQHQPDEDDDPRPALTSSASGPLGDQQEREQEHVRQCMAPVSQAGVGSMPANRSSSGVGVSTWLATSSKSSVGQTSSWISRGMANQKPSGSIWVAWASSAWSRTPK